MKEKKKSLYLLGAGDLGRDIESWLELLPDFHKQWEIKGFFDKNPDALRGFSSDYKILGYERNFKFKPGDHVIICTANPELRQRIAMELESRVAFFSYIAPNAIIGKFVKIGTGVIICPNVCIMSDTEICDFVFINVGSNIGHDCKIGTCCSLMSNVDIGGDVSLGEKVYIGANATIIPRISVNDNITIGAGSIVIRNLKKQGTYFGNPAKFISQ